MSKKKSKNLAALIRNIKYAAYCKAMLPPKEEDVSYEDLVEFALFQLSVEKHLPLKHKIWKDYADEEILLEYYAVLFLKNEDVRERFLAEISGSPKEIDLLNKLQELERVKMENLKESKMDKEEELPDVIEFVPGKK